MATKWIEKSMGSAPTWKLFVRTLCCVAFLGISSREAGSRSDRVNLLPKLQAGQTILYQISYRSENQTKTKSALIVAEAPGDANIEVRALVQLEIIGVEAQGRRAAIHARTRFALLNSDTKIKIPNIEPPANQVLRQDPKSILVEFTIFPDGRVDQITGLDGLFPEQQQAWREWASRFAAAATFPEGGVRIAQRWRSEESEKSPSPLAGLTWMRESTYVRNEPCRTIQMTVQGDIAESDQPPETCAVILTTAALKQQSPAKNATPEDFKLHELRTMGTARGKNKTITYISLKTGLVVRASDEADQTMNVTVAKADGTNRVHYDVHAKSNAEVLLVAITPLAHP